MSQMFAIFFLPRCHYVSLLLFEYLANWKMFIVQITLKSVLLFDTIGIEPKPYHRIRNAKLNTSPINGSQKCETKPTRLVVVANAEY